MTEQTRYAECYICGEKYNGEEDIRRYTIETRTGQTLCGTCSNGFDRGVTRCSLCGGGYSAGVKTDEGWFCAVCCRCLERGGVEAAWRSGFDYARTIKQHGKQEAWESTRYSRLVSKGGGK